MTNSINLKEVKYALADAFFLTKDIIPIIQDAGIKPQLVDLDGKAVNVWSNVLFYASRNGKVEAVLDAAIAMQPDNQVLKDARAGNLNPVKPVVDETGQSPQPVSSETLERITGKESTLLPVSWLEVGMERARAVAKVLRADNKSGTGFLLKGNLLLTNHHVLPDKDTARSAEILFNYQKSKEGLDLEAARLALDPDTLFFTSPVSEADWTVVKLKQEANQSWGYIEIAPVTVSVNDRANIIQHPGGGSKQIAFYHNIISYADNRLLRYLTDTLPGSSGAPVFNTDWQLIALHHSAVSLEHPTTKQMVYHNEGINANHIYQALRQKGLDL